MICGHCKRPVRSIRALRAHWRETGCPWGRPVWARVLEARRRGTSGRRILHEAYPHLWQSEPMPEERKAALRARDEERKAQGIHTRTRKQLETAAARRRGKR